VVVIVHRVTVQFAATIQLVTQATSALSRLARQEDVRHRFVLHPIVRTKIFVKIPVLTVVVAKTA
jgi:hypothetical protein